MCQSGVTTATSHRYPTLTVLLLGQEIHIRILCIHILSARLLQNRFLSRSTPSMTWDKMSSDRDLPPLYNSTSLPQRGGNLPRYSEDPGHSELRVMHSDPTNSAIAPTGARLRQFTYRMDYVDVNLGEFPSRLMHAAYGFNGLLEGVITFRKKCSYVTQLTVKVSLVRGDICPYNVLIGTRLSSWKGVYLPQCQSTRLLRSPALRKCP